MRDQSPQYCSQHTTGALDAFAEQNTISTDEKRESVERDRVVGPEKTQRGDHLTGRTVPTRGGPTSSFAQLHSRSHGCPLTSHSLHNAAPGSFQELQRKPREGHTNEKMLKHQAGEGTERGGQCMWPPREQANFEAEGIPAIGLKERRGLSKTLSFS